MAAGVTQQWIPYKNKGNYIWGLVLSWTDGNPAGTVPATVLSSATFDSAVGSYLFSLKTIPGTGGGTPTAYSFTLLDSDGLDILNGVGATRSATVVQESVPQQDSAQAVYGPVFLDSVVTLHVTGNTNVNATGVIKLFFSAADIQ